MGVGVVKNGVTTSIDADGLDAYIKALQGTLNDTDVNNYAYYDIVSNMLASGVADFDIMFVNGFDNDDYLAVTERNGNTFFELTALDINGNVISDASTLKFDSDTGAPGGYDWNTGYSSWYSSSQPQWMTVADIEKFGTNTKIYGFRIDNDGEADVKFFGVSDQSFVPEPSSVSLLGLGLMGMIIRRKR